jgi:hypothetical protein
LQEEVVPGGSLEEVFLKVTRAERDQSEDA